MSSCSTGSACSSSISVGVPTAGKHSTFHTDTRTPEQREADNARVAAETKELLAKLDEESAAKKARKAAKKLEKANRTPEQVEVDKTAKKLKRKATAKKLVSKAKYKAATLALKITTSRPGGAGGIGGGAGSAAAAAAIRFLRTLLGLRVRDVPIHSPQDTQSSRAPAVASHKEEGTPAQTQDPIPTSNLTILDAFAVFKSRPGSIGGRLQSLARRIRPSGHIQGDRRSTTRP
ncbi:hypothetical protein T440DRAFT_520204 [Plenodomus tracheiphilus IPT5]|uniref:Uncharacterized protein n=1 Tax=Plenodomus tracheiphilus IPT5 TaxID=1408161 RepID=A0A6A7AZL0_9PLEO|nr:hypothetical protein T440DRAFT_520204 [Plenodomus tracheiphilus IPT5]